MDFVHCLVLWTEHTLKTGSVPCQVIELALSNGLICAILPHSSQDGNRCSFQDAVFSSEYRLDTEIKDCIYSYIN
jgi:hypothetical protein